MAFVFQLFTKKPINVLGVDIGSSSVRLLELSKVGESFNIETYGIEYLGDEAVVDKEIKEVNLVGESIAKLVKQTKPSTTQAAIAVPGSAAISKIVQFPVVMSEDEIESQLEVEADKYIPYPLDEVNIDFELLGPSASNPDSMDVLLVAARSEQIDCRLEALELGGLKAKIVDTEVYAIERAYRLIEMTTKPETNPANPDQCYIAVFDIGATVTSIDVLCNGVIIYNREQSFGGLALVQDIMQHYDMSFHEAYLAKKENSLPKDYHDEVLVPFCESVVQQIHRSLQLFFSSTDFPCIDQIILAGGSASITGLADRVVAHENIPTIVANPIADMSMAPRVRQQSCQEDAASLMVSCGLAMRGLKA